MILFYAEDVKNPIKQKRLLKKWIQKVITSQGKKVGEINYIFVSDEYILNVNRTFLNHDYYTDIITFNNNIADIVSADIYISVDTVKSNATEYNVLFEDELLRVVIHGILHLIGFDDTSDELQDEMTVQENKALALFYNEFAKN